ncbi:COR domain-containing protein [Phaeodactylibacter xiamenensis]|uniref:COR domain-containing protein n=1 Tax=Phaeodactylibacter xiamenensis TaxID=1524460 RepID=UPI003BA94251
MPQPAIIARLEQQLSITIAPSDAPDLHAFMRYGRKEEDKSQYWLKDGTLTGLKLRTLGLQDASFLEAPELSGLQGLYLAENDFSSLHLPESLQQLQLLNLADNKALQTLEFSGAMPQLEEIDLSDSGIQTIHLPDCLALQKLDVSRSKLEAFSFASACPKLWWLDLSGNEGLSSLELPSGFEALQYLYLYKSGIQELQIVGKLPKLIVLDLEGNQLKQWPEKFLLPDGLETLYLESNPIENIPETIRGSGERHNSVEDVRQYLLSVIDEEKVEYLHQAKMILVGNGEVGKTSIRIKLLDPKAPLPEKKDRTAGLDIVPYELKQLPQDLTGLDEPIDFQLNIWDFGGQGKYREVQQLFFSPQSLYLFVTACDDTPEEKESYVAFDYWMSLVHALSYDREQERSSPVIHVVNKIDKERMDIDQRAHNRFGNVEEFHAISCKELTNFEALRKAIPRVLPKVGQGIFRDQYNEDWLWVMEALQRRQAEQHITYQDYLEVCKNRLDEKEARAWLRILDRIGTVIYFGEYEKLKDWIILNPNWVKQAVFEVIDSGERNPVPQWRFEKQIWSHYSEPEREKLLELLQAYDLAYVQQNAYGEQEFVIPALLEKEAPDFEGLLPQEASPLKLRFAFQPFLPAGTVNKLMVRLKDHIYRGLMWKDNVVVHHPDTNAYGHVEEDWQNHFVNLSLYGEDLAVLYGMVASTLESLNEDFKNAKFLKSLDFVVEGFDGEEWLGQRFLQKLHTDTFCFLWEQSPTKKQHQDMPTVDQVRALVARSRIDDAIAALKALVPESLSAEVLGLESRYSKLQRDSRMGILSNSEQNLERNQIVAAILDLAGEADREAGSPTPPPTPPPTAPPSPGPDSGKKKILFICSSPDGQNPLDFGAAFREIEDARQRADRRDDFEEVDIKTSVQRRRLVRTLTDIKPNVLHISLHSSKYEGLYFEGRAGEVAPIDPDNFRENIRTFLSHPDTGDKLDVVILDACNSLKHGEAILEFADYVVCTKDYFPDLAGRDYAEEFYSHFFNGEPVEFCHNAAVNLIRSEGYEQSETMSMSVHEIPTLLKSEQL